ncbi:MAG: hypothetical protein P1U49_10290 [Minwuia sp.]|nr:hypothetical protein [Minwuia sp.]
MTVLRSWLAIVPLTCLLLLAACDDPVSDAALAADFHDVPAAFISEVVRPDEAGRMDLTLRVNFSQDVSNQTVRAVMRALPAIYQGERPFEWYSLPKEFRAGSTQTCNRRDSLLGGTLVMHCEHSSLYIEGVYRIWPEEGRPPPPYRSKAEALDALRFHLRGLPTLELFYCGRTPNSCAPIKLPPLSL